MGPPITTTREPAGSRRTTWHVPLALISLAAAGIHFGVMDEHVQGSLAFGVFFAVVAWGQALWAVGMLLVPNRRLLITGSVGNLAVIAIWALSRVAGLPIGPEPWTPEAVGVADLMSTILEAVIVAGCGVLLVRGADRLEACHDWPHPALALGVCLAVLSSFAIVTGASHSHPGVEAPDGHGSSEVGTGAHVPAHVLAGGSGEPDLAQIDLIRQAVRRYEDVEVAFAEGWRKEHRDWPEIGAHFYRAGDWAGSFPARPGLDLLDPEFLMYSRFLTGEWKLVAVAYVVDQDLHPDPPTELTGAIYHEHVWNCIDDGEELEEEDWGVLSAEECEIMGGMWSPGGVWMTHVWLVDNPHGIFAETNPTLTALS
jgi:hypothetical protein